MGRVAVRKKRRGRGRISGRETCRERRRERGEERVTACRRKLFFKFYSSAFIQNKEQLPCIGYNFLTTNYPLPQVITTHYHYYTHNWIHANTKENTSKYDNKIIEIQIKVELRCPHQFSPDGRELDPVEWTVELLSYYCKFIPYISDY